MDSFQQTSQHHGLLVVSFYSCLCYYSVELGGNWEVGRVRFTAAYSNTPKHKCNKGMALVAKVLLIFMYLALKSNSVHAGL